MNDALTVAVAVTAICVAMLLFAFGVDVSDDRARKLVTAALAILVVSLVLFWLGLTL